MTLAAMKKTDNDVVQKARVAFIVGVLDLSWKLGLLFMIPVIVGFGFDSSRGGDKGVLLGSIIGFVLSVMYIFKMGIEATKK